MQEQIDKNFNHLKVHTQYSICEGTVKIDDLRDYCKKNKIKSVGISDTTNLCGALEFSENLSKSGTQPIIGTQIFFKYEETIGLLPLIALNQKGYKKIIELSSKSYLENNTLFEPHCKFEDLLSPNEGLVILSGSINGLVGNLFNKGKLNEIEKIYKQLNKIYKDNFYIEIQRHEDRNEKHFESFNLLNSKKFNIPIIASHEVFYLDKSMHEAHDALICIGKKTYINEKNRIKLSNQHYFKTSKEMSELFFDLPEALENNYNFPYRCYFRPLPSNPILPNIGSDKGIDPNNFLKKDSNDGLVDKFVNIFKLKKNEIYNDEKYKKYKKRLDHEIKIIQVIF